MIYRILLVDDEPAILDCLYHVISSTFGDEVEVYKADCASAAYKALSLRHFDIAILDISLPGISGISMLDEIAAGYPETRIIFLTGFQQFEYARIAVNKQVIAYVLKNEEDEVLLMAIKKAMGIISEAIEQKELLKNAGRMLASTGPMLRREFIIKLVQGLLPPNIFNNGEKLPFALNLDREKPICLCICSIAGLPDSREIYERFNMLFAAGLAMEQAAEKHFLFEYAMPDDSSLIWLLQNKTGSIWDDEAYSLLRMMVESAQTVYNRNTMGNLVFIYGCKPVMLEEIPGYYMRLRPLQGYAAGDVHTVLDDGDLDEEAVLAGNVRISSDYEPVFRKAGILQRLLEQGELTEFYNVLDGIMIPLKSIAGYENPMVMEAFMTVSTVLISYINKTGIYAKVAIRYPLYKLYHIESHNTCPEASDYFRQISGLIFELQSTRRETHTEMAVAKAREYILEHLNEDLSLIFFAERFFLNPSYFSTLFKAKTGMNLSEFIKLERLKKAKSLLEESRYRINEIARMVGFNNAAYFTKFFKSEMVVSPQEYRDSIRTEA